MFWDPLFDNAASLAGAPPSQIKLISTLLLSYPLASIYIRLPASRPNLAHLFSLCISTFFIALLGLGSGLLHLFLSSLGTYAIVILIRGPSMPWTVFGFTMGHLMFNHVKRTMLAIPSTEIEVTFTQMVLVMNLSTFAWNVHDGRQKAEHLDASQMATRLQHIPSPLPFLAYCFFFPSFLIGPSFDYSTYDALVKHTLLNTPPPRTDLAQAKATAKRIPYGRRRVAYLHLGIGLFFLGIYSVYGGRGSYDRILTPIWAKWSLLERFGFIQFAGVIARTKYYAVWSLSEGACILTGLGFNGYDPKTGRTLWNRVRNINILSIESAESFKVLFDSWNCRTNIWLRDCVYNRLVKKGKKPGSMQSMATFLTSAIWHGVDPGYYMAFITAGLLSSLGRQSRHYIRPYFLPASSPFSSAPNSMRKWPNHNTAKRAYDVAGWIMVQANLNYVAAAFLLLSFNDCARAWHRMGWYGHIIIIVAMMSFRAGGRRILRKGVKAKEVRSNTASKPIPSLRVSPPSPPEDEKDPKNLGWVKHAMDNPDYQDGGEGVHPDGGMVDAWVKGTETPRAESSRPKWE